MECDYFGYPSTKDTADEEEQFDRQVPDVNFLRERVRGEN